jgi:hypothetical protein
MSCDCGCDLSPMSGCACDCHELYRTKQALTKLEVEHTKLKERAADFGVESHSKTQAKTIQDIAEWLNAYRYTAYPPSPKDLATSLLDGSWARQLLEDREARKPIHCHQCHGKEQVWGVKLVKGPEEHWLMLSAFLQWTGYRARALEEANNINTKVLAMAGKLDGVAVAEQLKCSVCGKTNNPSEKT